MEDAVLLAGTGEPRRSVLAFEARAGGHSAYYLQYLADYWRRSPIRADLEIVLPRKLLERLPETGGTARDARGGSVRLTPLTAEEERGLGRSTGLLRAITRVPFLRTHLRGRIRYRRRWRLFLDSLARRHPDHALLLYLDDVLPFLAVAPPLPCRVSGILFKPEFHYGSFPGAERRLRDRLKAAIQKRLLERCLKRSDFENLFLLDPFASRGLAGVGSGRAIHLPEPARAYEVPAGRIARLSRELGLDPARRTLLMFGALGRRRGIHEVLSAVRLLSPEVGRRLCLLLVGPVMPADREPVARAISEIRNGAGTVEVVTREAFIEEEEILPYFHAADVVLVTHLPSHVGSSGNLLHAAAAERPVLACRHGLIGELVRRHRLGLTVDSTRPRDIADAMAILADEPPEELFDRESARRFARENSPDSYARTLVNALAGCLDRRREDRG